LLLSIAIGGGAMSSSLAVADPAPSPEPAAPGSGGSGGLEEIVVTATRREESINKVPISITAMSQDDLDQKGIRDFTDIVRFTPGVSIDTSGTNAISIRGISSSGGAGTTGIYIDDTPIQMRALGFNPDDTLPKTFDLDRVEVLRGPQGTLFGSGSEGGTVRYIMVQPSVTTDSTYARGEASYTEYGSPSYEAGVAHGGPIIDDVLGYRVSVWYRHDGGWINDVDATTGAITQANANYAGTTAIRGALLYKPASNVSITPSITFQNKQQNNESTYWPAYSNPGAGEFNNATPERIAIPDKYILPALKIQVDFENMSLISNTSYYYRNETDAYQGTVYDLAFFQSISWPASGYGLSCTAAQTAPPCPWYPLINGSGIHLPPGFADYSTPNTMTNDQRNYTQEVRLQSTDDGPLQWTVGAFWSLAQETSIEQLNDPNINAFFNYLYGTDAISVFGPYYGCNGQGTPQAFPNCDIYYNYNRSYDRQLAGFAQASYKFTDWFALTLGVRESKLGTSLTHYSDGLENFGPAYAGGQQHENSFTPKVGLSFQVDPEDLYYFTYAKGFRPGGYNPPLPAAICSAGLISEGFASGQAPLSYNSDTTQSFEIGSKNEFANRLKIQASAYYILWNNIQQNVYVAGDCGLQFTDNLGTAVAKGADLQADFVVGGGLSVEASVGYTDARFTKTSVSNLAVNGDAISGEAGINYAPGTSSPLTIALGPQYDFKLADLPAFVRLDWTYASRNPWLASVQDPNSSQYDVNSYTLPAESFFSMRAGVKLAGWQISAFCDNLLDSHTLLNYAQVQPDAFNPNYESVQQNNFTYRPRTIGITATFRN